MLPLSAVKGIAVNGEALIQSTACCAVSPPFSSVLQITTKQCQFIKSLFVRLIFYILDNSRCFLQCHSTLSRPFMKCYPQNCREILSLTIAQQSTEITSYLYAKVQHLPLSQQYTTMFSLWSSFILSPNPFLQNCDLIDLSLHCIYVVHCSCQGTIVCTCLYWITSHFFSVPLVCQEHYEF